jgi:hypothetical protein
MATLFRTLFGYLFRDGGHPTFYFDEAEWNLELELAASAKEAASADAEGDMMVADLVIDGVLPEEAVERLENAEKIRGLIERRRRQSRLEQAATARQSARTLNGARFLKSGARTGEFTSIAIPPRKNAA